MAKRDCEVSTASQNLRQKQSSGEVQIAPPPGAAPLNRRRLSRHLTIVTAPDAQQPVESAGHRASQTDSGSSSASSRSPRLSTATPSESSRSPRFSGATPSESSSRSPRLPKCDELQSLPGLRQLPALQRPRASNSHGPHIGRSLPPVSGDGPVPRSAHKRLSNSRTFRHASALSSDSLCTASWSASESTRASSGSPSEFEDSNKQSTARSSIDGRNGKAKRMFSAEVQPVQRLNARAKTSEDLDREFEEIFDNASSMLSSPARTEESLDRYFTQDSLEQYLPSLCDASQPSGAAKVDELPTGTEAFGQYAQHVLRAQTARRTSLSAATSPPRRNTTRESAEDSDNVDQRTEGPVRAKALAIGIGRVRACLARVRANQLLTPTGDMRLDMASELS